MTDKNKIGQFLTIWLGDLISTIGSGLTAFSLGIYAYQRTGLAASSAMVVLCTFLPAFILRPIGGVLADRYDRFLLMYIGNLGSALGVGLTWYLVNTSVNNLTLLYPGILLSSAFFALQNPSFKACVSNLLTPEFYSKASGLLQLSGAAQFLIAPFLGGLLMSLMDIKSVLLIDIFSFVFSAMTVLIVKLAREEEIVVNTKKDRINFIKEMTDGLAAITSNKGILWLVIIVSILLFYVGLIQTLLTPLVLSFADVRALGTAQSICGTGMLFSSIIISIIKRKTSNVQILAISLALMGISFSCIGIKENIWSIIIPGFMFFSVIPFANSSIDVLIRQNIGEKTQGRVWALISVFTYLGSIFAFAVSGFLADKIFNPMFMNHGILANTMGNFFGIGQGRGIAFMFFLSGMFVLAISFLIYKSKLIWHLDQVRR